MVRLTQDQSLFVMNVMRVHVWLQTGKYTLRYQQVMTVQFRFTAEEYSGANPTRRRQEVVEKLWYFITWIILSPPSQLCFFVTASISHETGWSSFKVRGWNCISHIKSELFITVSAKEEVQKATKLKFLCSEDRLVHESLVDCPEVPFCEPVIFHQEVSGFYVTGHY